METRTLIIFGVSGVRLFIFKNAFDITIGFLFVAWSTKQLAIFNRVFSIEPNWDYVVKTHDCFSFIKRTFKEKFNLANIANKITFFSNKALLFVCKYCFRSFNNRGSIDAIVPVVFATLKNSFIMIFGRKGALTFSGTKFSVMPSFVCNLATTFFTCKKVWILSVMGDSFHLMINIMRLIENQALSVSWANRAILTYL
jgi:hypothetical protein